MQTLEYLFGESTYLGLLLFLLVIFLVVRITEATIVWIWDRYGDWISNVFRQSRS